jgi:peptide/nickel transport system substrate-binding protein
MQNRFGFKDFVTLVLLLAIGVFVWLSMVQRDREWELLQVVGDRLAQLERDVARLNAKLESGVPVAAVPHASVGAPGVKPNLEPSESWARPGVPVTRADRFDFVSDPTSMSGYKEGGTFTEVFEGQAPKITPYLYSDVYGQRIVQEVVGECLAGYDPATLAYEGWLAEAWQYDPAGMWLRVKIDDRARFSDGMPVTAEDVQYTYEFINNPQHETERFRSTVDNVVQAKPISEKVVEFEFKEPRYNSLDQAMRTVIIPKHFYAQFQPSQINGSTGLLMGSGPYKLATLDPTAQWAPPQPMVFVRNEQYWGRRPPLDSLRFVTIQDNIARLTAFENGEGDMVRGTPEQYATKSVDADFVERAHALAWTNMRSGYTFIAWNCGPRNGKLTPFHDKRVRQAMTHLLDRERIRRDFVEGLGQIATGPFNPLTTQASPEAIPYPPDVAKARQLLNDAGWQDRNNDGVLENAEGEPFDFEFTYSTGSALAEKVGKYLLDQSAKVGIRCHLKVIDWALMDTIQDARDFDAITLAWSWGAPESDPMQIFHSSAMQNQGDNWMQWSNAEADRLIETARREVDSAKRMPLWHQLDLLIQEEQPYTFLLAIPWIRFVDKRVHNVHPYAVGLDKREMFIP